MGFLQGIRIWTELGLIRIHCIKINRTRLQWYGYSLHWEKNWSQNGHTLEPFCRTVPLWRVKLFTALHSHKQSAHSAVDVTAQVVPCWLSSWLNCNFWQGVNRIFISLPWRNSLISFRQRSTAEWASCSKSVWDYWLHMVHCYTSYTWTQHLIIRARMLP